MIRRDSEIIALSNCKGGAVFRGEEKAAGSVGVGRKRRIPFGHTQFEMS